MSFHQSLEDLLSAQDLDDRDYHSDTESDRRPASTPPHSAARHAHRQDVDLDEQVVPSLRAQDLAGRIRSYQGLLWRRNAKGRARGWTRRWFKVAPGRIMMIELCILNLVHANGTAEAYRTRIAWRISIAVRIFE